MKQVDDIKIKKKCIQEMQKRLRKYDVAYCSDREGEYKDKLNHYFNLEWDSSVNLVIQKLESSELAESSRFTKLMSIISSLFHNEVAYNEALYKAMEGGSRRPQYSDEGIPQIYSSQFSNMMDNLQLLQNRIWRIYKSDIILAVAFHAYLEEYTSDDKIVKETAGIEYEPMEYLNLPISLEIKAEKSLGKFYFVDIKLCNGILNKIAAEKCQTKNLFKKREEEYSQDGLFGKKKDWAVKYGDLKKEIIEIIKSGLSIEDIWFLENVFDPELIVAMEQAVGKSIKQQDYKLLYIICKCKCPSIRLYLLEAVAPCYRYIRENVRPLDEALINLFSALRDKVEKIQDMYESMTIFTSECIQQAGLDFAAIREGSSGIINKFYCGNDFPFLYNQKLVNPIITGEPNGFYRCDGKQLKANGKENQNTDEKKKSYVDYIAETPETLTRWNRIAYGVITALNECWKSDINIKLEYGTSVDFRFALFQHIHSDT